MHSRYKIMFSGGGTLGSVTPLLGLAELLKTKHPEAEIVWVITKNGPERPVLEAAGYKYIMMPSAKLRRYWSWRNLSDFFIFLGAFWRANWILWKEQPRLCISAGAYVSVPLHWAAWLHGVPTWIHQLDVQPGLANRLMARVARLITVALPQSVHFFPRRKTVSVGNFVRPDIGKSSASTGRAFWHISDHDPLVLVIGGGTGAERINELIVAAAPHLLPHAHVVHSLGAERPSEAATRLAAQYPGRYRAVPFLGSAMAQAYAAADLVITRGGFGTLTELAALRKAAIVIPKPGHQQANVKYFLDKKAVIAVDERLTDGDHLSQVIRHLLQQPALRTQLGAHLHAAAPTADPARVLALAERFLS